MSRLLLVAPRRTFRKSSQVTVIGLRRNPAYYKVNDSWFHFNSRRYCTNRPVQTKNQPAASLPLLQQQPDIWKCIGCGSILQTDSQEKSGYVKPNVFVSHCKKLVEPIEEVDLDTSLDEQTLICQRCHYLKNYNTALNITLSADDYKHHLTLLKDRRALVILVVDAVDFPGSLFPELHEVLGPRNHVQIVVNKIDLLPNLNRKMLQRLEEYIRSEAANGGLRGHSVGKVWFVSSKTGTGIKNLSDEIVHSWGNRGDIYLLGCTNVGKSSLFNHLIVNLCGALPGDSETVSGLSAPAPVISHWPGTTLGLISFPVLSVGKRKRLLAQSHKFPSDLVKDSGNEGMKIRELFIAKKSFSNPGVYECLPDIKDILEEIGHKKPQKKQQCLPKSNATENGPVNKQWLHDTPGAINDIQVKKRLCILGNS